MSNDLTDEQKKRLIDRLEKDAIERRKQKQTKITLKKKEIKNANSRISDR